MAANASAASQARRRRRVDVPQHDLVGAVAEVADGGPDGEEVPDRRQHRALVPGAARQRDPGLAELDRLGEAATGGGQGGPGADGVPPGEGAAHPLGHRGQRRGLAGGGGEAAELGLRVEAPQPPPHRGVVVAAAQLQQPGAEREPLLGPAGPAARELPRAQRLDDRGPVADALGHGEGGAAALAGVVPQPPRVHHHRARQQPGPQPAVAGRQGGERLLREGAAGRVPQEIGDALHDQHRAGQRLGVPGRTGEVGGGEQRCAGALDVVPAGLGVGPREQDAGAPLAGVGVQRAAVPVRRLLPPEPPGGEVAGAAGPVGGGAGVAEGQRLGEVAGDPRHVAGVAQRLGRAGRAWSGAASSVPPRPPPPGSGHA
ncbi:hypothetical protein ACPPVO_50380 [Dactylosporangium sp. McL0621]|uniref:hypothetical protein n=1 Tax=Dactylosporangium sp. McL0621 TaxID=3415678 RepID=UPI003CE92DF4